MESEKNTMRIVQDETIADPVASEGESTRNVIDKFDRMEAVRLADGDLALAQQILDFVSKV